MEVFIYFVAIVGGILNLILYFKIWGMTNNVKKIKKQIVDQNIPSLSLRKEIVRLKMLGRKEEAIKLLNKRAEMELGDLLVLLTDSVYYDSTKERWESILEQLKKFYAYLDAEMPENLARFDIEEFRDSYSKLVAL